MACAGGGEAIRILDWTRFDPQICWTAAMSIVALGDIASAAAEMAAGRRAAASAGGTVQAAAVLVFAALSLARSAAVLSGYHAPMALYAALPQARRTFHIARTACCCRCCLVTPSIGNSR